ncbi:MAG TPA: flagellar basal body rod protein FlgB [Phenylobacterium sp.]|nr:flagellar basal body rod protein FlgB [Phenylobacterium sp.]
MEPGDIPLLAMLKGRLGYLSDRQRLIAENVANSDTPGYKSRDLKAFSFQAHVQAASGSASGTSSVAATPAGVMAVTQPGHMQPKGAPMGVKPVKAPDSEVTLDGNGVVLEDEMVKLTQARMDYDAAIGFYQKSIGLLKMAIRKPGAG